MKRLFASNLSENVGQKVLLKGWLHSIRPLGKINFVIVRDCTGLFQVVLSDKHAFKKISALQPGSVLAVIGTVIASEQADLKYEIVDAVIDIMVPVEAVPPVEYYKPAIPSDLEHILDFRSISLRNRQIAAVFKIQAELAHAYRVFMHDNLQATEYFGPNVIGASSEGGAEFFSVDYFGQTATLAQSSQLYKQMMVGAYEKVYAIMPFFRAENSNTTRHLTEGKQFEFEMGFFDSWTEIMDVQEDALRFMLGAVAKNCASQLATLEAILPLVPSEQRFPRLSFSDAQEIYFQRSGIDERTEPDLSPAAERELCRYSREKFGSDFIFITDWFVSKRPFYSEPSCKNADLTNTYDLLCAGTEITSGGQRRHTYKSMLAGLELKGMDPSSFVDYLNIFKYGMPPHGGFGMGLERLTMTILNLKNIREASLFPSDPRRIAGNKIKQKLFFGEENIRNEIIRLFKAKNFDFELVREEFQPADDVCQVKAIILKGKNSKKNYQFNLPLSQKIDMKAVANIVGEKCEFEDGLVLKERFGLLPGGVPPMGQLLNLETFYDDTLSEAQQLSFNCAFVNQTMVVNSADFFEITQPKFNNFSKA